MSVCCVLAWFLINASRNDLFGRRLASLWTCAIGLDSKTTAMRRERGKKSRSLFPLTLGSDSSLQDLALRSSLDDFCDECRREGKEKEAWILVTSCGLNGCAGFGRAPVWKKRTKMHQRAAESIGKSVQRMLNCDAVLERSPRDAEKELSSRFLSYTGEEVPKMQIVNLEAVVAALPPESHGGSIDALQLVCDGTKKFLEFPEDALLDEVPKDVKLQAKVHVPEEDKMSLAEVLVKRRLCVWVPEDDVLRVGNQKVLNGLFAVGKGSFLQSGEWNCNGS